MADELKKSWGSMPSARTFPLMISRIEADTALKYIEILTATIRLERDEHKILSKVLYKMESLIKRANKSGGIEIQHDAIFK